MVNDNVHGFDLIAHCTAARVSWQFWTAACTGKAALVVFALSRGGADLRADVLVVGAVLSSSWCYVVGASVTGAMPAGR